MIYTFNDMVQDLLMDFSRYEENAPIRSKINYINKILTLFCSPAFIAIAHYRYGTWMNAFLVYNKSLIIRYSLKVLYNVSRFIILVATKIMIRQSSIIEGGLFISNRGNCFIGAKKIGKHCSFDHSVVIGMGVEKIAPTFGNNVKIGPRSLVFGNIAIGDHVIIESNSIVSRNIPDHVKARGNPAKIVIGNNE